MVTRNFEYADECFVKAKNIFLNDEKLKTDLPKRYVDISRYRVMCLADLNKQEAQQEIINELKSLQKEKEFQRQDIQIIIYTITLGGELYFNNLSGHFEKNMSIIQDA